MTETQFNLIDDPWIPALTLDSDDVQEYNIIEILTRAHEMHSITHSYTPYVFSLLRFLGVILTDMYQPSSIFELADLLGEGHFDPERITAYFDHERQYFNLFGNDDARPFLQVPINELTERTLNKKTRPIAKLFYTIPSASNKFFFQRHFDDEYAICPAECARLLVSYLPFSMTGGRSYQPGPNNAPPIYTFLQGASLFETLCYTMIVEKPRENVGTQDIGWREPIPDTDTKWDELSTLFGLTVMPRNIRLFPEEEGGICSVTGKPSDILIREMYFLGGTHQFDKKRLFFRDPFCTYTVGRTKLKPLYKKSGQGFWSYIAAHTFLTQETFPKVKIERPLIVNQFYQLLQEYHPQKLRVCAVYLETTQAKIFVQEVLDTEIPIDAMTQTLQTQTIQHALEITEFAEKQLRYAIRNFSPSKNRGRMETAYRNCQARFWQDLEVPFFEKIVFPMIETSEEKNTCIQEWVQTCITTGEQIFHNYFRHLMHGKHLKQKVRELITFKEKIETKFLGT